MNKMIRSSTDDSRCDSSSDMTATSSSDLKRMQLGDKEEEEEDEQTSRGSPVIGAPASNCDSGISDGSPGPQGSSDSEGGDGKLTKNISQVRLWSSFTRCCCHDRN